MIPLASRTIPAMARSGVFAPGWSSNTVPHPCRQRQHEQQRGSDHGIDRDAGEVCESAAKAGELRPSMGEAASSLKSGCFALQGRL